MKRYRYRVLLVRSEGSNLVLAGEIVRPGLPVIPALCRLMRAHRGARIELRRTFFRWRAFDILFDRAPPWRRAWMAVKRTWWFG